ncbi:MAG: S41 family peptidase [Pirellulales bacterium]
MTRLNLNALCLVTLVSLLCYHETHKSAYGRYFVDALEVIHHRGLEQLDRQTLFDAALRGMAQEHDEHSNFITREDKKRYLSDLEQQFTGIGIRVEQKRDTQDIVVVDTIIGKPHPAHDAGMRPGDRIVAINGTSVVGELYGVVVNRIRGPRGKPVTISVVHEGATQPEDLVVIRSDIAVDSVMGNSRDSNGRWEYFLDSDPRIGYLRLTTFGERSADEMREALTQMDQNGPTKALIVDVRDNEGGFLDAAHEICDLFVDDGVIVTTNGPGGVVQKEYRATVEGTFGGFPVVVLANRNSASASEIFAACLQDHQRGKVIGQRTYGKGSVQQMIPMEGNRSLLKLTTASYWRPNGKNIHRLKNAKKEDEWGVRPDDGFEIELTDEQELARRRDRRERDKLPTTPPAEDNPPLSQIDPQLQRAIEYLQSELHEIAKQ